jgi:hypothetical protein
MPGREVFSLPESDAASKIGLHQIDLDTFSPKDPEPGSGFSLCFPAGREKWGRRNPGWL